MSELALIFVGGLLGSSHCLGMCGSFALSIGAGAAGMRVNLFRQAAYSGGRIFTYAVLGAMAGFGGMRLAQTASPLVNVQALLAILAGALLILQGLLAGGVLSPRGGLARQGACLAGSMFAAFLARPGLGTAFVAGMLTGLLPCGLVYAFLALAASAGGMAAGLLLMAAFGAGTVPLMVIAGCGGSLLSLAARRHMQRAAAWCVVLTGAISVARGMGFLSFSAAVASQGCPFCP